MNNIRSIVDIGCGDWQFMQFVDLTGISYHGFDVVENIVDHNTQLFARKDTVFSVMPPQLGDLPNAELVFVKDVLQHLPNRQIMEYVKFFATNYKNCLITNPFEKTYTHTNVEIEAGGFRCLDLTADPFNVSGTYLYEYWAQPWERIRTLLCHVA